jgi:hypothetical protein
MHAGSIDPTHEYPNATGSDDAPDHFGQIRRIGVLKMKPAGKRHASQLDLGQGIEGTGNENRIVH